jgi:hypothetical protein
MKKLAAEARSYGISIGLKNAEGILRSVQNDIQYAVNEECNIGGDCGSYSLLLNRGKPVFHIEYAKYTKDQNGTIVLSAEDGKLFGKTSDQIKATLCLETTLGARKRFTDEERAQYSTVIKTMNLDGWVMYCDGTWGVTKTKGYGSRHGDRGGGQDDKTTGHTKPTFGLGKNPRVGQPTASDPPQNQVESGRGWKGFLSGKNSGRKPASPAHPPPQRQSPADDVGQTSGGESHQDQGKSGYGWIGVKGWKNIGQKPGIAREAPPKSHQSPSNVVDPSPDDGSSRSLGGNIFGWKGFQGGKNASWKPTYPVRPLPQRQPPADDVDSSPEESTRQSGEDEVSKKNDQRSYGGQKGYGQWGNMGSGRRGASNGREDVENENDEDTGRENQQTRGRNDENGAGSQRGADGDRI